MISAIKRFFREGAEAKRFNSLPDKDRQIVFYAEGPQDFPHYKPVIDSLKEKYDGKICYVTSAAGDPILEAGDPDINTICIGSGTARTLWFKSVECGVMIITLPELGKYNLKRSVNPVHYIYIYHSINSTHMVYRKAAFDAYDTICCVGPHHREEMRKTETVYNLKPKELLDHGYGRLDDILKHNKANQNKKDLSGNKNIVMAPSWGTGSFIEQELGRLLVKRLLELDYNISLRFHPMTVRHLPELVAKYKKEFAGKKIKIITDMHEKKSLHEAGLMISDWSGAVFEFAFGMERPVLFVNTPPKVNNPEYEKLEITPLEVKIRTEIGDVLDPGDLGPLENKVKNLMENPELYKDRIQKALEQWIYNPGKSGEAAAEFICEKVKNIQSLGH